MLDIILTIGDPEKNQTDKTHDSVSHILMVETENKQVS